MMEHIVTSHIMTYLQSNGILCPEQHGFRRRRSCETQLLGYIDETTTELEKGNQMATIVLDFSKAFDKVSHTLLVHTLQRYGIRDDLRWGSHINSTTIKANKTSGFLRRNLKIGNKKTN
ncbi:uncharacterized protein LOC143290546 [Babylonia areolata]|uniref:uncharacterized protein LOC143290546 n=1 Tax=Babylonia areolata TaxID=304850 RepID=UPI003FD48D5D